MVYEEVTARMSKEDFLKKIKEFNPNANLKLISKAYDFAKKAHSGQLRKSGEPYFIHLTEVAYMLAELRSDTTTIVAALLHDVLEDTSVKPETIKREFGNEVFEIVEAVTKIQRIKFEKSENVAENIRKVVLATAKDFRVILLKLVDRLHNMRTLRFLDENRQKEISKETLEIYVPIAYKLGMHRLKSEMEDLCLKYLNPQTYEYIKKKVGQKREVREREVVEIVKHFKKELLKAGFEVEVFGRAKSFYSIYKKMVTKKKSFEEIHDLIAIRIITNSVEDCYKVLGYIHSHYKPIMRVFKDYIAVPKPNGYQSIHTTILFNKKPVEIQIRTWDMHYAAEDGIAAHWRYKGTERDKQFDRRINWLKRILDWLQKAENAEEFIESLKVDLFKDEIVVLTPKGDPIILPEKATPVDFAYAVHTELGNHCSKALVNGKLVGLDTELESGDVVEIITSKNAKPSRNWLRFVKTKSAAQKIRRALGITKEELEVKKKVVMSEKQLISLLDLKGLKPSMIRFAKCCNPKYGDEIIGVRTRDGKVTVHKKNCANQFSTPENQRFILRWKRESDDRNYSMTVRFVDRVGLLSDILNVMSSNKINIKSVKSKTSKKNAVLTFQVSVGDDEKIEALVRSIKSISNVLSVDVRKESSFKEEIAEILRGRLKSRFRSSRNNKHK